GGGCVGGVVIRADLVAELLGYRSAADHYLEAAAGGGSVERLNDGLHRGHGGGEKGAYRDDVDLRIVLDRLDELLSRDVDAKVDDLESGGLDHHSDEVLTD